MFQFAQGTYHLVIKLSGKPENIETFHEIMGAVDSDWPWNNISRKHIDTGMVCSICKGAVISNPRVAPQDIKAGAKQADVKVKIFHYAISEHCVKPNMSYPIEFIPKEQLKLLYTVKPDRVHVMREKIVIDRTNLPDEVEEAIIV